MRISKKLLYTLLNHAFFGPLVKKMIAGKVDKEALLVSSHFDKFLRPQLAYNQSYYDEVFSIRHQVYCEELAFEEQRPDKKETDEFDRYAQFCLIEHKPTGNYAGCVRIVTPHSDAELLPIEKYCGHAIEASDIHPKRYSRHNICEISRLAVPKQFRRRQADNTPGIATGGINIDTYSEEELRCFPFIAVGLYLTAASTILRQGIEHCFVMMEPRLARSMAFIGIRFQQLGKPVEYHGKRAPYYINPELFLSNLSPGFKNLLSLLEDEVDEQMVQIRKKGQEEPQLALPPQQIWVPT